jgi:hypothetical protein
MKIACFCRKKSRLNPILKLNRQGHSVTLSDRRFFLDEIDMRRRHVEILAFFRHVALKTFETHARQFPVATLQAPGYSRSSLSQEDLSTPSTYPNNLSIFWTFFDMSHFSLK